MARTTPSTAVAVVLLALALSGCGDDGDPSADSAPTTTSASTAPSSEAAASSGAAPSSGAPSSGAESSGGTASSSGPAPGSPTSSAGPAGPARGPVRLTDGVWTLSDVAVERRAGGEVVTARVANGGPEAHTGFFALRIYAPGSQIAELRGSADVAAGGSGVVTFSGEVPEGGLPGDPSTYTYEFLVEATL